MARKRNEDDNDFLSFLSDDSIDKQAEHLRKAADEVMDHIETRYSELDKKLEAVNKTASKNLKEAAKLAKEIDNKDKTTSQKVKDKQDSEDNSNGLKSLVDQATRNSSAKSEGSAIENLTKSIISQTGPGKAFDNNWSSIAKRAGKILLEGIEQGIDAYFLKPINRGISDMFSAYENNFTEIAGRMGTTRSETYSTMREAIVQLNDSSYKNAVNANRELIPALTDATQKGFTGQEAISVALTNSVDKKIMPWLDTNSAAWTQIQYNVSTGLQDTLKAQQLQLQESRSGNRLLQSGVINQITSDIAPVLSNIDYNTVDKENLSNQLQSQMQYYLDRNFSEDAAYKAAAKDLEMWRNPTKYLENGSVEDVFKSVSALQGGDVRDMNEAVLPLYEMVASMADNMSAGMFAGATGLDSGNGGSRVEDFNQKLEALTDYINDANGYIANGTKSSNLYDDAVRNATEKVTATTEWDNRLQNTSSEYMYFMNKWTHGEDLLTIIQTALNGITRLLGGKILVDGALKIGKALLNGESISGAVGKAVSKAVSPVKSLVTSAGKTLGKKAASTGAKLAPKAAALSNTLSSIGGGSTALGTAAVAAPVIAGLAIGKHGISKGVEDLKEGDHKTRGVASIAGGAAAAVGGVSVAGGMLAAGAANAWNPVGWGLLIAGAVTVAATSIHRHATALNANEKAVKNYSETLQDSYKDEVNQRKLATKDIISKLKSDNITQSDLLEARSYVVKQGLMSQEDAQNANIDQLIALTSAYLNATDKFSEKDKKKIDNQTTKLAQEAANASADKQTTATKSVVDSAIEESQKNEYSELVKKAEEGDVKAKKAITDKTGNTLSYNQWSQLGKSTITEDNVDLSDSAQGQSLITSLSEAIDRIDDDKKKKKLQKKFNKYAKDGWSVTEYEALVKKINKAGATTDTWNDANTAAGLDNFNADVITQDTQEISELYNSYASLAKDLHTKIDTIKKTGGDANSLMPTLNSMANINIPYEDKESIRSENKDLKTEKINKWLIEEGISEENIPKYNTGISYVPEDQLAFIHQGEAVLNKQDAEEYRDTLQSTYIRAAREKDNEPTQVRLHENSKDDTREVKLLDSCINLVKRAYTKLSEISSSKSQFDKAMSLLNRSIEKRAVHQNYLKDTDIRESMTDKPREAESLSAGLFVQPLGIDTSTKASNTDQLAYGKFTEIIGKKDVPKYDTGISYVPEDQFAYIHEGEAVLNKEDATDYRSGFDSQILKTTISSMNSSTIDITEIVDAIRSQTSDINKTLNVIIQSMSSKNSFMNISAKSSTDSRMINFNPSTNNTRNIYSN